VQVSAVQLVLPHRLAVPDPPQLSPDGHWPQSSDPPQPSPTTPQYRPPVGVQLVKMHELGTQMLSRHVWPEGHEPQLSEPPQPLPMVPQYWPPVDGVHVPWVHALGGNPHTPVTPAPPQVSGAVQLPHSSNDPQPSPMVPQYWPPVGGLQVAGAQNVGMQMPELQVCPAPHTPQSRLPPQRSPMTPQ
jgi:hypothetical protein